MQYHLVIDRTARVSEGARRPCCEHWRSVTSDRLPSLHLRPTILTASSFAPRPPRSVAWVPGRRCRGRETPSPPKLANVADLSVRIGVLRTEEGYGLSRRGSLRSPCP